MEQIGKGEVRREKEKLTKRKKDIISTTSDS